MKPTVHFAAAILLAIPTLCIAQTPATLSNDAKAEIRQKIDTYLEAVNTADPQIAARVWLTTDEATFIHPVGEAHGWREISSQIYETLMGKMFSKRALTLAGEPEIHVFGNAAVAEFHWDFIATRHANGAAVHNTGRESQMYVHFPDQGWRLVHVHYSGPPVNPGTN